MLPGFAFNSQRGYIGLVMVIFMIIVAMIVFPYKFPPALNLEPEERPEHYCRDLVDDPNAPIVEAPSYDGNQVLSTNRQYRLIKERVPIDSSLFLEQPNEEHFFNSYKEVYTNPDGQKFIMRLPKGQQGRSYKLPSEEGNDSFLQFSQYGLLYLFHTSNGVDPLITDKVPVGQGKNVQVTLVDIYKAVDTDPLPSWVLTCYDVGLSPAGIQTQGGPMIVFPDQERSPDQDELQLEWFLINSGNLQLQAWWTPHCKPAVYLYPERKQLVNVRVYPKGELGFTDPFYDFDKGWTVTAYPDGSLMPNAKFQISNAQYEYLYYESKIRDEAIEKPTEGWVVRGSGIKGITSTTSTTGEEMEDLFDEVLPRLGLNAKEQVDFSEYWLKSLPEAPYYFVGLVDKEQRDYLEELRVTPEPDTSIRFSFYFEPLEDFVSVPEPAIKTPERVGFTLVDWGGMIKLHKDTPFTCSQ